MDFLQDLTEAKIIGRSKSGLKKFNARDIADLLFLHLCALQILKYEFFGLPEAQKYVMETGPLTNFDYFLSSRNEIYLFVHILIGKKAKSSQLMLKDQEASLVFLKTIKINLPYLRKFLKMILAGQNDAAFERRFLLMMERDLRINDNYYKAIRRLASTWSNQSNSTKKLVMTRLLQIMRAKARRSELMNILEWVSKQEKLENKKIKPLKDEGPGQKKPAPAKKASGFLKKLALGTGALAVGAYAGYKLTKKAKK